jgi:hypothetical protein
MAVQNPAIVVLHSPVYDINHLIVTVSDWRSICVCWDGTFSYTQVFCSVLKYRLLNKDPCWSGPLSPWHCSSSVLVCFRYDCYPRWHCLRVELPPPHHLFPSLLPFCSAIFWSLVTRVLHKFKRLLRQWQCWLCAACLTYSRLTMGGSTFLRNIGKLPCYMTSHTSR